MPLVEIKHFNIPNISFNKIKFILNKNLFGFEILLAFNNLNLPVGVLIFNSEGVFSDSLPQLLTTKWLFRNNYAFILGCIPQMHFRKMSFQFSFATVTKRRAVFQSLPSAIQPEMRKVIAFTILRCVTVKTFQRVTWGGC